MNKSIAITIGILVIFGIVMRLVPHAPNIAPIGAIALFAGMYMPKKMAIIVPITAMLIGDFFIGFYNLPVMISVYGSFALMAFVGMRVKQSKSLSNIFFGTLVGSLAFFLITNGAVWFFGGHYAKTFSGLIDSYTMALPFFRNTLTGNLIYVGLLVGGYEVMLAYVSSRKRARLYVDS